MKRNKRTIYEIADIAKVSPATVSKVLNNREGVGADVRQRVLEIVERERFVPKMVLSDTNTIAIIYRGNEATMSLFHSEYMMHIMRGVSECVFEHGYHMVLFPSNIIPKRRDQFSLFCRKNRLAGCIWCNLRCEDTYVQDISGIIPQINIVMITDVSTIQSPPQISVNSLTLRQQIPRTILPDILPDA